MTLGGFLFNLALLAVVCYGGWMAVIGADLSDEKWRAQQRREFYDRLRKRGFPKSFGPKR